MEYNQWKATEFRQFLLYTGPVVLQGCLPTRLYKNFMLLSVAYCDYADKLLKCYVTNFVRIYGSQHLVYNTHSLIHLADDTKKFGVLDSVSRFPFENCLGTLKRQVRRPQNPLQQVVTLPFDHGKEIRNKLQQPHLNGPTQGPVPCQYAVQEV